MQSKITFRTLDKGKASMSALSCQMDVEDTSFCPPYPPRVGRVAGTPFSDKPWLWVVDSSYQVV